MPTPYRAHMVQVAKTIKKTLGTESFLTLERIHVTELIRSASGEESTRLKSAMATELERALLEQGVRCFPSLVGTSTGDVIRFFHAGTTFGALVDLLTYPDPGEDDDLEKALAKVRPVWRSTPLRPVQ